jgi:hypothetical protein
MFSKANRRFLIVWLAITLVALGTIVGAVYLVGHDKQGASVWTGGGAILTLLLGYVRAEMRAKDAETGRAMIEGKVDEIERKTNGNLTRAIKHVAEEVRTAAHEPAPGQEQMPRTPEELQALLKTFARTMVDDLAAKAAQAAAARAAEMASELAAQKTAEIVVVELRKAGVIQ